MAKRRATRRSQQGKTSSSDFSERIRIALLGAFVGSLLTGVVAAELQLRAEELVRARAVVESCESVRIALGRTVAAVEQGDGTRAVELARIFSDEMMNFEVKLNTFALLYGIAGAHRVEGSARPIHTATTPSSADIASRGEELNRALKGLCSVLNSMDIGVRSGRRDLPPFEQIMGPDAMVAVARIQQELQESPSPSPMP